MIDVPVAFPGSKIHLWHRKKRGGMQPLQGLAMAVHKNDTIAGFSPLSFLWMAFRVICLFNDYINLVRHLTTAKLPVVLLDRECWRLLFIYIHIWKMTSTLVIRLATNKIFRYISYCNTHLKYDKLYSWGDVFKIGNIYRQSGSEESTVLFAMPFQIAHPFHIAFNIGKG